MLRLEAGQCVSTTINLSIGSSFVAANFSNRVIPVKLIKYLTFGLVQIVWTPRWQY